MRHATLVIFYSVGIFGFSCSAYFLASSRRGFEATELKRAAFDLRCPIEKVEVTELVTGSVDPAEPAASEGTVVGVSGCGQQATYKYFRDRGWVVQTAR